MNLLGSETSPYLRQHKDNPVDWMPWGAAALERARAENKPVLLSVGYSACHWCHVMAHESFEDAATADLMNQNFINIKVDREERPDIDALYQGALSLMGKAGGWPLTMFLTPEAKPFWGGTYFPPQARGGMPSFREVLRRVAESYGGGEKIEHNIKNITTALEKINSGHAGVLVQRELLDKISKHFLTLIDVANGGIGAAPKFPNLTVMNLLWDSYVASGDGDYKSGVIFSLTQMCQGGIYDHVGGGFSRYTVDAEWLVPHFEKMLYDNAQFIALLAEVYKETQHPLFARRISETISWAQEELSVRNQSYTAFAASFDADSEGVEGKYYIWTSEEVDRVLGTAADRFKQIYDVTKFGNWEGVNILNRLKNPDYLSNNEEMQHSEWLVKLKTARSKRVPPARDGKVLADWNGLMITALAKAGAAMDCHEWIDAAHSAFNFVTTYMAEDGKLLHSWCDGRAQHAALLEDYANMAEAALALYDITPNPALLAQAENWVRILNTEFHDEKTPGYFMSAAEGGGLPVRPKSAYDSATPSGNGTIVGVLTRLYYLTGNAAYREQAEKTITAFSGEVIHHAFPFSTLLRQCGLFLNPLSVVIIAAAGEGEEFRAVLRRLSLPFLIKYEVTADHIFPKDHPAYGKAMVDGKTTAYVCPGQRCLAPSTTPQLFEEQLKQARNTLVRPAANDG